MFLFVIARRRRNIYDLIDLFLELVKEKRSVVKRRRKTETVFDKTFFSRPVAAAHSAHLRNGDMALVDEHKEVLRKIIEKRIRRRTRFSARKNARIVLNAFAVADSSEKLDVVHRALAYTLSLDEFSTLGEILLPFFHFADDLIDRFFHVLVRRDIMDGGKDDGIVDDPQKFSRRRVDLADTLDLVVPELDPDNKIVRRRGEYLDHVSARAEHSASEIDVVSFKPDLREIFEQFFPVKFLSDAQRHHHIVIFGGISERVYTRNARDDYDVSALKKRRRRGMAQTVDLVVDRHIFFYICVRVGDIRLGLVIIVIGNKVFDRVFGEELAELRTKLSGKRFVVREHERRTVDVRDDVRHRECFSRTGNAEQRLFVRSFKHTLGQFCDRLRLISRRLVIRHEFEFVHTRSPSHFITERNFHFYTVFE